MPFLMSITAIAAKRRLVTLDKALAPELPIILMSAPDKEKITPASNTFIISEIKVR